MDADFSHSPTYLPQCLEQANRYDVIVGSRYVQGGQLDLGWIWRRYGLSWWAPSIYVRLLLKLDVRDATAGFKCWSRAALAAVLAHPVRSGGYIFQVEMAYLAHKLGLRVRKVPIFFEDRRAGVKLEAVWRTWLLPWQYRHVRPAPSSHPSARARTGAGALVPALLRRSWSPLPMPLQAGPGLQSRSRG